ncbi:MAG TPA: PKD domain-containing protein, partial [Bacteroidetes bacterium]|nr:PKD domain-containing protein [Bacteroidota bacterium]
FILGEVIDISVDAEDIDNNLEEVRIFIDNIGVIAIEDFPFFYSWDTSKDEVDIGNHEIKAMAIDDLNASSESSITIRIADNSVFADFNADITEISVGESISFSDNSTGFIDTWSWDFGDKKTSDEQNPSHNYELGGIFTIELVVSNDYASDKESKTNYITVKTIPTVITTGPSDIQSISAIIGGNITNNGYSEIIDRGVFFGATENPVTEGTKIQSGTGEGQFSTTLNDLSINTTYYYQAFATNSEGTSYGSTESFTTDDGLPEVTTKNATNIKAKSAISGGEITNDGSFTITSRGICWSENPLPTINDNHTVDGVGLGTYESNLENLELNTRYYVRAYATNANGIAYGNKINFLTDDGQVVLNTSEVFNIGDESAQCNVEIVDDGGWIIVERGICWDTSSTHIVPCQPIPYVGDEDSFTSNLTGLYELFKIYVRSYIINELGETYYGNTVNFYTTGTVTDYDGNSYKAIRLGEQSWMAENLRSKHYYDGTPLVDGTGVGDIYEDITTKYYFYYNDNPGYLEDGYGLLYTWAAVMNGETSSDNIPSGVQGVCPTGWHVPSDAEWKELEMYLGMSRLEADGESYRGTDEAFKMKTQYGWAEDGNGSNESGFSGLPAGNRNAYGSYYSEGGRSTGYWTSTSYDSEFVWCRILAYCWDQISRGHTPQSQGLSIRCTKDQ